jgi:hypothetical protein
MISSQLRVGIIIDSYFVPSWFIHTLSQIQKSGFTRLLFIYAIEQDQKVVEQNGNVGKRNGRKNFIFPLFDKIDRKIFLRVPDACTRLDLRPIFTDIPIIEFHSINNGMGITFSDDDQEKIRSFNLDILVEMRHSVSNNHIASLAKYGFWFYDFYSREENRSSPPAFWEVIERKPYTESALYVYQPCDAEPKAIYHSSSLTHPFSPARNGNIVYWLASSFLPRQIKLLYQIGGEQFFNKAAINDTKPKYERKASIANPSNLRFLNGYIRLFFRILYELFQRSWRRDMWFLMIDFSATPFLSFDRLKKISPPRDRFWADPLAIHKDGSFYIFIEEYIYANQKGHISVIEMDAQGSYKNPVPVLEKDYHLSYPFVFEYLNRIYMVPESGQNRTIDLYECEIFPCKWKFKQHLMENVNAVDTTLFFYNEKWWLFTGITENEGAFPEVELFLFYSSDLFTTEWKSHPLNPVISDVTSARPAGGLFERDGKIYRPSQDCSVNYGHAFNINEIICLSETEYQEKKINTVTPDWDRQLIATHTYTNVDGLKIIDGLIRQSKLF